MRTESWLSDMTHYLDYYPDDNGYFIDFLGAMIPIPIMDKVQRHDIGLEHIRESRKQHLKIAMVCGVCDI